MQEACTSVFLGRIVVSNFVLVLTAALGGLVCTNQRAAPGRSDNTGYRCTGSSDPQSASIVTVFIGAATCGFGSHKAQAKLLDRACKRIFLKRRRPALLVGKSPYSTVANRPSRYR